MGYSDTENVMKEIILVVLLVVMAIVGFGALIYIGVTANKNKWRDIHFNDLKEENERLKQQIENQPDQSELWEEKVKSFENRIVYLNQVIDEKKDQLRILTDQREDLETQLEDLKVQVYATSISCKSLQESNEEEWNKKIQLLNEQNALDEAIQASKTAAELINKDIKILENEVNDLKERKRLSILNQNEVEDDKWDFSITHKENELISILERIKLDYPELKLDISTIEWKKIWLPKIQDLTNSKGLARKGIYRLILKKDENICYVGQAVNIKDRWYQHIKKMIGVESKGMEKVYDYRPEDFYWTVIEFDSKDLNDSEHYWIDYFGCKERGLNKKA